ncbi:chloride channel protein [Acetobacter sp. DsW_063]|uniref:chloride channel protein n=1 Tax=Acetobacter sp. DsW_063 TaxID=1514894 RepID=UPI000A397625|nr:chloride channel protein [Acetobacter sp. DsW_063]
MAAKAGTEAGEATNLLPEEEIRDSSRGRPVGRRHRFSGALQLVLDGYFVPGARTLRNIRCLVRVDSLWLLALAALVGSLAGLVVAAMTHATLLAHAVLFGAPGGRLSGLTALVSWRCAVPAIGGLALGLFGVAIRRSLPPRPVDPIEANALHGGRMSLRQSVLIAIQTIISNGSGASIGLEAGFTQLASAAGARLGCFLRVHRADMRLLVGCGAAGAIGAAFDAPLAGAFYAFELVIGSYTMANLAPVALASICATGVATVACSVIPPLHLAPPSALRLRDCLPIAGLGAFCALSGIALMRVVTLIESGFNRTRLPVWSRPALGGAVIGGLALLSPTVLSSGHMAMRAGLMESLTLGRASWLFLLKALASAVSIGSGFRGGLFFASLYLGVLNGAMYGDVLALIGIDPVSVQVCAMAGMCALAVAVIGGPMTMIFLALETTGSFPLTVAVLISALTSSFATRRWFGYSFATWRFHLRGESIRSAVDVGRVRSLTVEHVMQKVPPVIAMTASVGEARRRFEGLQPRHVIVTDELGKYAGLVAADAYNAIGLPEDELLGLLRTDPGAVLRPYEPVRDALATFERIRAPALVVLGGSCRGEIVGLLTERYVLRRFAKELERAWRDIAGDV